MKKVELLLPAGNMDCLRAAVNNKADAVYLAGKNFGARKYANNFSDMELKEAVIYAHLYDVKVYVTVNTLVYDSELSSFFAYIGFLASIGVDALIMQDLGMIDYCLQRFKGLEIHASTQAHNHNDYGLEHLKKLGVKRAVLARELSLKEINNLKCDIDKEVFIYGALCVCYSGLCLFSSMILGRSGNRGECAGFCRLPFTLYDEKGKISTPGVYLLSPKELNTFSKFDEILASPITSLKIEGRMKSKEYVGFTAKVARNLIDEYYEKGHSKLKEEDLLKLKLLYNRDFTLGHLNGVAPKDFYNVVSPNHIGIEIGDILAVDKHRIKVKLSYPLAQNDGIRFPNGEGMIVNFLYDSKGLLTSSARANEIVYLDNKVALTTKGKLRKTLDTKLLNDINNVPPRKIAISFTVAAHVGEALTISVTDFKNTICLTSAVLQKATKVNVTKEAILEKLSKLGNTPFVLKDVNFDLDKDVFIPISLINDLRRQLVSMLIEKRTEVPSLTANKKGDYDYTSVLQKKTARFSFYVKNEEQLRACLLKDVDIYLSDSSLYEKYKNTYSNIYLKLPRVVNNFNNYNNDNLVISELGSLEKYAPFKDNKLVSDVYFNVTNAYTLNYLIKNQVTRVGLSVELTKDQKIVLVDNYYQLFKNYPNVEVLVYGRIELMIIKDSFMKALDNSFKEDKLYYLKDRNKKTYPVIFKNGFTTIYNYETIDNISEINDYRTFNITNFRIDLFDESYEQVLKLLDRILNV